MHAIKAAKSSAILTSKVQYFADRLGVLQEQHLLAVSGCVESVAFRAHYPAYCVGGCSLAQFNSSYPLHLVAELGLQSLNLVKQTLLM